MFSKKRWNIYSFSKDTVWGFSSTIAIFLEAGKMGNLTSSENDVGGIYEGRGHSEAVMETSP